MMYRSFGSIASGSIVAGFLFVGMGLGALSLAAQGDGEFPPGDARNTRDGGWDPATLVGSTAFTNPHFQEGLAGWQAAPTQRMRSAAHLDTSLVPNPTNPGEMVMRFAASTDVDLLRGEEFQEYYQVIKFEPGQVPVIKGEFFLPRDEQSSFGGFYVRCTLYAGENRVLDAIFHNGGREERLHRMPRHFIGSDGGMRELLDKYFDLTEQGVFLHFRLNDHFELWHRFRANLPELIDGLPGDATRPDLSGADSMYIAVGNWCGDQAGSSATVLFRHLEVVPGSSEKSFFGDVGSTPGFMNLQPVFGRMRLPSSQQ